MMHGNEHKRLIRITNRKQSIFYPGIITPSVDYLECDNRIELLLTEGNTILEVAEDGTTRPITKDNLHDAWVKVTTTDLSFVAGESAQIVATLVSGAGPIVYESSAETIVVSETGLVTGTESTGTVKVKTGETVHATINVTITAPTISEEGVSTMSTEAPTGRGRSKK